MLKNRIDKSKEVVKLDDLSAEWLQAKLDAAQQMLFDRAKTFRETHTRDAKTYDELKQIIEKDGGFVRCYFEPSKESEAKIKAEVELLLMHEEKGFENLVIKGTTQAALERFASQLDWPPHILKHYPEPVAQAVDALGEYFAWSKGSWGIADFLAQCSEAETPTWIKEAAKKLKEACVPPPPPAEKVESADANAHPEASVDGID